MSDYDSRVLEDIIRWDQKNLNQFIDSRKPAITELLNEVKGCVPFERHIIGGSVGKGTSLGPRNKIDLDINLFISGPPSHSKSNDLQAFLRNQVEEIAAYLDNYCGHLCEVFYRGPVAIGLRLHRGNIDVDLIPGIDFGRKQQYEVVLDRLAREGRNLPWANVCYAEESVRFIRTRNNFTLDVILLAKIWNKRCVKMGPLSGRSVIVETVALKAAQEEWGRYGDLSDALVRFFKYMEQPSDTIRVVASNGVLDYWSEKVYQQVKSWRHGPPGYVVDPVNPYRNFLDEVKVHENWHRFRDAARKSLQYIRSGNIDLSVGWNPQ